MRLPRRVPWATLAQLEQVYSWVYDPNDSSRDNAIERLSAWKFMMPLPHALESLLSILVAIRQESTDHAGTSSSLSLRQSYATAIIRLVNGLVDPLQLGTYARSISSIAAQIGLPAWLVELRHAATHEDLPSLELLRDGAKECLSWLLHNYFLPTLNPALPHASPRPPLPIRPRFRHRPAEPLLRQYKNLLKKSLAAHRDGGGGSGSARHDADIRAVLRDIERWLAEARVAADTQPPTTNEFVRLDYGYDDDGDGDGDDGGDDGGGDDRTEAWALDRLCEALLARGALVPLSRKKRAAANGPHSHYPPPSLLAIWTPLLESLVAGPRRHAYLRAALSSHIVARLLADHQHQHQHQQCTCPDEAEAAERASYERCLAAWGAWLVEWRVAHETDADVSARRQDVFFQLIHALCASCSPCPQHRSDEQETAAGAPLACQPGARALLAALCASDRRLAEISATVLRRSTATARVPEVAGITPFIQQDVGDESPQWKESYLDVMDARLQAALSLVVPQEQGQCTPAPEPGPGGRGSSSLSKDAVPLHNGWRLLAEKDGWRPCPVGIYIGSK